MALPSIYAPFSPRSPYSPLSSRHNSESFLIPDSSSSIGFADKTLPSPSWLGKPVRRLAGGRSRLLGLCFVLGMLLGYVISNRHALRYQYDRDPTITPQKDVEKIAANSDGTSIPDILQSDTGSWAEDPYFYPPLPGSRSPKVPKYNRLSSTSLLLNTAQHLVKQRPLTPLFVPFTRNNPMLQQTILSYIASGWPRSQIYIIDNTGTMTANPDGLLSPSNPFFLDYSMFRKTYGVNIIRTPAYLSFSQLQNFMLSTAVNRNWTHYFWSHQDVVVLSDEDKQGENYKSFYEGVLKSLVSLFPRMGPEAGVKRWGVGWYSFDWLTIINVSAAKEVGPWDPFIPFYHGDCDYYERVRLSDLKILNQRAGHIYDVALHIPKPEYYFFGNASNSKTPGSERYKSLKKALEVIQKDKNKDVNSRNKWQDEQKGGGDEEENEMARVWSYDPKGFQEAWWETATSGRRIYKKKWGSLECRPGKSGKQLGDMWEDADVSEKH